MRACARFLPNQAFKGLIVPSKFYSSIAAGRAVKFVGDGGNDRDGEIAREVAREIVASPLRRTMRWHWQMRSSGFAMMPLHARAWE